MVRKIIAVALSISITTTVPMRNGSANTDYGELILPCAGAERAISESVTEEVVYGNYYLIPIISQSEIGNIKIESEAEKYKIGLTESEQYLLAKIVKCEAGNQSKRTKFMVLNTIYNRVLDNSFPNTIKEVIFQEGQFSPISDGSWYNNEPTDSEYSIVNEFMKEGHDYTAGALYFESSYVKNSWQSKTKTLVVSNDDMRFYK